MGDLMPDVVNVEGKRTCLPTQNSDSRGQLGFEHPVKFPRETLRCGH